MTIRATHVGSLMIFKKFKVYRAGKASQLVRKFAITCTNEPSLAALCMRIWDHHVLDLAVPMRVHARAGLHAHDCHLEPRG